MVFTTFESGGEWSGGSQVAGRDKTRRELLLEQIAYNSPTETPLLSILPKVSVDSIMPEWTMGDIERTPDIDGDSESQDFSSSSFSGENRTRAGNYTHIKTRFVEISDTQRMMNEVGVQDEYSHQIWREMLGLAIDFEYRLNFSTASFGTNATPGTSDIRTMHGIWSWAQSTGKSTNTVTIAGHQLEVGTAAAPADYRSTWYEPATVTTLTRDLLYDEVLEPFWARGGEVDKSICFVGAGIKRTLSGFSQVYNAAGTEPVHKLNELGIAASAKELFDTIDVYHSDCGTLHVSKNRYYNDVLTGSGAWYSSYGEGPISNFSPHKGMLIFEPRYMAIGVLEGMHVVPLAKTGLTTRALLGAQLTFICRNPKAIAAAYNVA